MEKGNIHIHYHDKEYGFPIHDDNGLFARLILEINQAGLSWTIIVLSASPFHEASEWKGAAECLAPLWLSLHWPLRCPFRAVLRRGHI